MFKYFVLGVSVGVIIGIVVTAQSEHIVLWMIDFFHLGGPDAGNTNG